MHSNLYLPEQVLNDGPFQNKMDIKVKVVSKNAMQTFTEQQI